MFDANQAPSIIAWADHCLLPDARYSTGVVSSIYFDDQSMSSYFEKRNSDFVKSKIRLRWYDGHDKSGVGANVQCYLEQKGKLGPGTHKKRKAVQVNRRLLEKPFSNRAALHGILAQGDTVPHPDLSDLMPVVLIRYRRRRYFDAESESRVSIDTSITGFTDEQQVWAQTQQVSLDSGVIEIKGNGRHLPAQLQSIASLLCRESFSKYGRCCEFLSAPISRRI